MYMYVRSQSIHNKKNYCISSTEMTALNACKHLSVPKWNKTKFIIVRHKYNEVEVQQD